MRMAPTLAAAALAAAALVMPAPARAQTKPASSPPAVACGSWVSDAYNNAYASRVGGIRPDRVMPPASTDPCEDNQDQTDFVRVFQHDNSDQRKAALTARLDEIVIVRVQHLQTLVDQSQCVDRPATDKAAQAAGGTAAVVTLANCTKKDIVLFLDNRAIGGMTPEAVVVDKVHRSGTLRFHLERKPDAKEAWADLLGLDLQGNSNTARDVRLSVGLAGSDPIPTAITSFHLVRIRVVWLITWLVLAAAALWLFFRASTRTDLLRDGYPYAELGQRRPFSLARVQGAWWTLLTLFAFAFIWLVTGQRDFSTTALTLLGITAGTAIGARIIDAARPASATNAPNDAALQATIQTAIDRKRTLEAAITLAEADVVQTPDDPLKTTALKTARDAYQLFLEQTRRQFPQLIAPRSEGLLTDILSDTTGVSFHRFQMAAWAATLGVIFVVEVLARLAMPIFDPNLLALLGISSGTYLGLKIPE